MGDEEDAALSPFDSFCRRAQAGQLPHIEDRDDLWKTLFVLTARKSVNLMRVELRQKRGAGQVRQGSAATASSLFREERTDCALTRIEPTQT
jgi:hypothetical protein